MQHADKAGNANGPASGPPSLAGFHAIISKRLAELRLARNGRPVFGLEHGLSDSEVAWLSRAVGSEIRERGLGTSFYSYYLALVAAASEVGYGYRGTGTDFWPTFEKVLGARIADHERAVMSDLFETAHRIDGIRRPVDSPWALVFRHIAWPIGNAVAPKEIHRGLARALRESYRLGGDVPDEEVLVSRLRSIAGRVASPRLVHWLEDADLAAAVAWRLLDQPDPYSRIADNTLQRIFGDLAADSEARKAVVNATALHRRRVQTAARRHGDLGRARLMIQDTGSGTIELLVGLPYMSGADREALRTAVARAGFQTRLWGATGTLDPDTVFSGVPVVTGDIDLLALCNEAAPFIPFNDAVSSDVAETLLRLAPDLSLPILLVSSGPASHFVQAAERVIPEPPFRLLVEPAVQPPAGIARKGQVAGFVCLEIDHIHAQINEWLRSLGLARSATADVEFAGAVALGYSLHGPVFPAGQSILIRVTGAPPDRPVVLTARGIPPVIVPPGHFVAVKGAPAGEHLLEIDAGGQKIRAGFTVAAAEPAAAVLSASIDPPAPSADDVMDGRLALHLRFALPLRDVEVAVAVSSGGYPIARVAERVTAWPASFTPQSTLLQALVGQLRQAGINRSWQLELAVEVGGVWKCRWPLGWELRHCDWENVDGEWRALAEDRELAVEVTAGSSPLAVVSQPGDVEALLLRTPILDGAALPGEALCTAPPSMLLGGLAISLPGRKLREPNSRDGLPGILATVASWLAWASAKPEHVVADVGRRRVAAAVESFAVAQLCGEQWTEIERQGGPSSSDFWSALTQVAMQDGLAAGGMLPDIEPSDRPRLAAIVAEALAKAAPGPSDGYAGEDGDGLAGDLDMAVIDAYEEFGRQLVAEGRPPIEDPDANNSAEAWLTAIRKAGDIYRAPRLAALILPHERALELMRADYRHLGDRDLLALLIDSHVDLHLRPPAWLGAATIETALAVWIDPRQVAARSDWQDHIRRLVPDRQTARAVRYAALRYRAARGMGSGT